MQLLHQSGHVLPTHARGTAEWLQAVINGEPVTLAELDGRYLSAETAASFTGRVAGVFASRGTVTFDWFRSEGREPR